MAKRENTDVPGNAMASAEAFTRQMVRIGELVTRMERIVESWDDNDVVVDSMRVVFPGTKRSDYMLIVNASHGDEKLVCFQGGATFGEALVQVLNRLENRSVKWAEDKYRT